MPSSIIRSLYEKSFAESFSHGVHFTGRCCGRELARYMDVVAQAKVAHLLYRFVITLVVGGAVSGFKSLR